MTHTQLIQRLSKRNGAVILGIVAETDARLKKTGNPFPNATKLVHKTVVTGASYQSAVEKQGAVGFKSAELPYGTHLIKNKVIANDKGEFQLRVVARNPRKPISTVYMNGSEEIPKTIVNQFMPEYKGSKKQAESGVKGKKQVMVQNYSFKNIKEIHIDGQKFKLVP